MTVRNCSLIFKNQFPTNKLIFCRMRICYIANGKIEINNIILEILGCEVSPIVDCDVENRINKFKHAHTHTWGIIHRTVKYENRKEAKFVVLQDW